MVYRKFFSFAIIAFVFSTVMVSAEDEGPSTQLTVKSDPEGAKITINHKARGRTPLTITDLVPGRYLIHAQKDDYDDAFEAATVEANISSEVNLILQPLRGLLIVHSNPAGAEVSNAGISLGNTPLLITTLPCGMHRLSLALPGYQTKEINVNLAGRTPVKQVVELVADSGTVNVRSEPAGAEVLINGITRGNTPCTIERIPGGAVKLEVKQDGYMPHSRDIALAAGEEQSVNITLEPLPGNLNVVSIPPEARVYINNEFKGDTPFTLEKADPGEYRVRVEKPGYTVVARDVTIDKGSTATEEFRLEKNTGKITVITAPAGCTVLIDGKKKGITTSAQGASSAVSDQLTIDDIIAGEHTVEIIRKGYGPKKNTVTIKQDQTTPVQVKLTRQFIPNYEVTTTRSYYKGVLEFINEEGIRLETRPGITQTIPMKDVKEHGPLKEE